LIEPAKSVPSGRTFGSPLTFATKDSRENGWSAPVPVANLIRLAKSRESVKLLLDDRALQTDLVRAGWIVPIASLAGNRDPGASPPAQYSAAQVAEAADARQHRSLFRRPIMDDLAEIRLSNTESRFATYLNRLLQQNLPQADS
jgi:hypothetical protein